MFEKLLLAVTITFSLQFFLVTPKPNFSEYQPRPKVAERLYFPSSYLLMRYTLKTHSNNLGH